ncbi:MAG: ribosome small subunit-dependent GTPase A [Candidatus Saccharimonadales bacterium]
MSTLAQFGWTDDNTMEWSQLGLSGLQPARVIADFGTSLKVASPHVIPAELSGKLAHYSDNDDTPKVGDWVAIRILDNGPATVESVVIRKNEIARKIAGKRVLKQIIATNVDVAFVLLALDNDFSVERLKRFVYQLSISAIDVVIILNKADKTDDVQSYVSELESFDIPIIVSIATTGFGVEAIAGRIAPGRTAILLGSSGVGKSTLTNRLLGRELQKTSSVRESDSTGRHTTVHRELFILPGGGILIDTPGIRELQLWGTKENLDVNYNDIVQLVAQCEYSNCRHTSETGCAINKALVSGTLDRSHYDHYLKMKKELSELIEKNVNQIRHSRRRQSEYAKKKKLGDKYDDIARDNN